MGKILDLYQECLNIEYIALDDEVDFATKTKRDTLYIYFQCSTSEEDWRVNFNFPAKPYSSMETSWKCHRGFLSVWEIAKPYIKEVISNPEIKKVIIVGYSHGAAIATLCHEYVWFNRPDLRETLEGYAFGCPRVFFGKLPEELQKRWERFTIFRNRNDIVSKLPPKLFGFKDVNIVIRIGDHIELKYRPFWFDCLNSHFSNNYINSIKRYEEGQ